MGLLHNLKSKLAPAKDKVSHLAHRHEKKIHHGIDKAARTVDEKTKGKYSDRIHSGTGKAKGAMDRLAHKEGHHGHKDGPGAGDTFTPPTTPPPPNS
ncbi:antitoxin [Streptomyces sp. NPDC088254]|uniref:antitoxin n=1 Tax=Streptomyces sp. NPDC088254 TaxID=3365847 RepID=UPI0037FFD180